LTMNCRCARLYIIIRAQILLIIITDYFSTTMLSTPTHMHSVTRLLLHLLLISIEPGLWFITFS
jgi:hypothetical protein